LQNIIKEIENLSQLIKKNIQMTDNELSQISIQINTEKTLNEKLTGIVGGLVSTNNSSQVLIDNSKEQYNDQYLRNLEMILGIFMVIAVLSYRFESRDFIIKCMAYVKSKAFSVTSTL
jgi:phosphotransferase system IIB component